MSEADELAAEATKALKTVRETVWSDFKYGVQTIQVPDAQGQPSLRRILRISDQNETEILSFVFPYAEALQVGRGLSLPHIPTASPEEMAEEIVRRGQSPAS